MSCQLRNYKKESVINKLRMLLVTLLVGVLWFQSQEVLTDFQCPEMADCSCSEDMGTFEILCPKTSNQPALIVRFFPNVYMDLNCTGMKELEDLRLLSGLKIGPVNSIDIMLCPLPEISFKELMLTLGIPSSEALYVESYSGILTSRHLEGLHELEQLSLISNDLTKLPEDLFKDVENLISLNLGNNNAQLTKATFRYVPNLKTLLLDRNNINYLEPGIFRNLTKLSTLYLHSNRLTTLPPDVFADLKELKEVCLEENEFQTLPQSLFRNTQQLEKIEIKNNGGTLKTLPPAFFANLTKLIELTLTDSNLSSLPEDLLLGCVSLKTLWLHMNLLTELPEKIFKDIKDVTSINLSYNRLVSLPESLFSSQQKLVVLYLSHNKLTTISQHLFSSLNMLYSLELGDNGIKFIHPEALKTLGALNKINLSHNKLAVFHGEFAPSKFGSHEAYPKMFSIDLSYNLLSTIYSDWRGQMGFLQILNLSHNNVTNLTIGDLQFKANEVTLDFLNNKITMLLMNEAEEIARPMSAARTIIILKENPFVCDCHAYHLVEYLMYSHNFELELYMRNHQVIGNSRLICDSPEELKGTQVTDVDHRQLFCPIEKVVKRNGCPNNCSCLCQPSNSALLVNCSYRGLTSIPSSLPTPIFLKKWVKVNHTELDLTGNKITFLPNKLGKGYSDVTKIYLSYNNLTSINLTSFSDHLQIIVLDHNNLTRIDEASLMTVKESKHIKNVSLLNNPWICDCQAMFFLNLMRVNDEKIIELDHNNLTRIDEASLKTVKESKNIKNVSLHNNPWIFDCQAMFFLNLMQVNDEKISNQENLTCSNGVPFSEVIVSDLCLTDAVETKTMAAIVTISVTLAFLCLLLGGSAVYYRYQREIKVWLYANKLCLWFVTEEELDKDKLYDAFISYSHQDERFVVEDLVPGLENGPTKFKLCLHYRDWVVGEFIPNQIARSVEESRRTVVILSPNFLESIWGRMEFRAAHSQALSEGRVRVILILYGDIGPVDNLDPELKAYLSMNTYIKWGDPWFWEKLRYALPHSPELSKGIPLISHPNIRRNSGENL